MSKISIGFDLVPLKVPIEKILPSRKPPIGVVTSRKYAQIRSSITEVGLIEPLSVAVSSSKLDTHVLLDGHIRLLILAELGYTEVPCLVASDDVLWSNLLGHLDRWKIHHLRS